MFSEFFFFFYIALFFWSKRHTDTQHEDIYTFLVCSALSNTNFYRCFTSVVTVHRWKRWQNVSVETSSLSIIILIEVSPTVKP